MTEKNLDKEVVAFGQSAPTELSDEERKKFTFKSPYPQEFSIPSNIICYIARNPSSPDEHENLVSTCKTLLRMSRIIPVKWLSHNSDNDDVHKWYADNESIILNKQFVKLWIYKTLCILPGIVRDHTSNLIKQVYKFSLRHLILCHQVLTFEELQILVSFSNLKIVYFDKNVVKNSDGSVIEFEKVFELLCCKRTQITFHPEQNGIGRNMTRKIIKILSSDQFPVELSFNLLNIPQSFNILLFYEFLKANTTARQHSFYITFSDGITDAYKNQLQQFVNEIIEMRGIYAHTIPKINFPGQNDEAYEKLLRMRRGSADGILRMPHT